MERREARRSALWTGSSLPLEGQAMRKAGQRVRRSAPANFGAPLPSYWECEGFETDNLARQSAGMRRAATLPHGSTNNGERTRCRNLRTDLLSTVMPALDAGIHEGREAGKPYRCYALRSIMDGRVKPGNDERWVLAKRTQGHFGETNPRTGFGETNPSARA